MSRSRLVISRVIFGLGVSAILFGGFGLLTHCTSIETMCFFIAPFSLTSNVINSIFAICEDILFLFALRGFYIKHARQAGWLGIPGMLVIAAAYIIQAVAFTFLLFLTLNLQSVGHFQTAALTLEHINELFIIFGQILLGLAIIRAGIYPRWTGILIIALGVYNTIAALVALLLPVPTADTFLLESFVAGIASFFLGVLYVRWAIVLFKK